MAWGRSSTARAAFCSRLPHRSETGSPGLPKSRGRPWRRWLHSLVPLEGPAMSRSLLALGALLAGLAVVGLSPWLSVPTTLHGEVHGPEGPLAGARVRRQASNISIV